MLMTIMRIVCYIALGLMVGVILMSLVASSGYKAKCDNCIYKEVLEIFEIGGGEDETEE